MQDLPEYVMRNLDVYNFRYALGYQVVVRLLPKVTPPMLGYVLPITTELKLSDTHRALVQPVYDARWESTQLLYGKRIAKYLAHHVLGDKTKVKLTYTRWSDDLPAIVSPSSKRLSDNAWLKANTPTPDGVI